MIKRYNRLLLSLFMISALVGFVLISSARVSSAQRTVVIDPGHGSAANQRDYEGTRELALGLKLKSALEQKGYKVVLTHSSIGTAIGGVSSGEKQDNIARANVANSNKSDLSIRLHSDDRSDDRFVILYPDKSAKDPYGFSGPQDASIIPKSKSAASTVAGALAKAGYNGSAVGETSGFRNGGMIQTFSAHSSYPGITLELYGHNNSALRDKYASSSEQDKVAKALAEGINTYLGNSGNPETQGNASASASGSSATGERLPNADPRCPTQAPNTGPTSGDDYQAQVAQAFMRRQNELAQAEFGAFNSTDTTTVPVYTGTISETAKKVVALAQSQVGYHANDDHVPYWDIVEPSLQNQAWCVAFVTWCYIKAGTNIGHVGGTSNILEQFRPPHYSVTFPGKKGVTPMPGDAFEIYSSGSTTGRHAGVVESVSGNTVYTIEGNTGPDLVARRKHPISELIWIGRW